MVRALIGLGFVLSLSGCAADTGVVAMGNNGYMIARQRSTGFAGLGNQKAEIIASASRYCAERGRTLTVTKESETQPPYVLGNYPRSEVQFTCDASSPAK